MITKENNLNETKMGNEKFAHVKNDGSSYNGEYDEFYRSLENSKRNNCYLHLKKIFKSSIDIIQRIFKEKISLKTNPFDDKMNFHFKLYLKFSVIVSFMSI